MIKSLFKLIQPRTQLSPEAEFRQLWAEHFWQPVPPTPEQLAKGAEWIRQGRKA